MTTIQGVKGIHHITAFCGDPQRNVDFCSGVLGLRMVKVSVNQDDPGTYHLYYGDETGAPGTAITFFPWPDARRGRIGHGQVAVTAYSIPAESIDYWRQRLVEKGFAPFGPEMRFNEQVLSFEDPDGLLIELVADQSGDPRPGWAGHDVPAEHAIRGFHSATIWFAKEEKSMPTLQETLGFKELGREGDRIRLIAEGGLPGQIIDLIPYEGERGLDGIGTVHHIAWRAEDDAHEMALLDSVHARGLRSSGFVDRQYFHSIYFREPGGVLYEVATDGPGFTIDEPVESLGHGLMLTPWHEPHRAAIRAALPALTTPAGVKLP